MPPDAWQEIKIGDLVASRVLLVSDGYRMKNEELGSLGIPFVRGGDIGDGWINTKTIHHIRAEFIDRLRSKLSQPGDTAFITKGTVGRAGFLREGQAQVVFAPQVAYWRSLDKRVLAPRFIYYLIRSSAFQDALNADKTHGSMVADYVSISQQHNFRFRFPPIEQQEAISHILGALDDKIELNRRMNETLGAMARAIYKDWFVDFGPTRTKMEGRAPYLAAEIWSLFPGRLDDEGKPEGWVNSTIGQEVDVVGGSTPSTKEPAFWGGDIAWATPKDLSSLSSPVVLTTERQITEAGLAQIGSGLLPVGTVLLSSRAPIGYMAIAQIPVAVNQGFIAMICKRRLSNVFVWLWTEANMETVHQNANGSTFQEISKANFRPIEVTIATPEILRAFDEVVVPLFERIVANEKENCALTATRDFLLPKLMSGEVDVTDATSLV